MKLRLVVACAVVMAIAAIVEPADYAGPMVSIGADATNARDQQATSVAKVAVQTTFCTDMVDTTAANGSVVPQLTFKYQLCVDASTKSWKRVDAPGRGELIFNGTHLFSIGRKGCNISPYAGDPLKAMPFTMLRVDEGALQNGSTVLDGIATDVWHAHRAAEGPGVPAEEVYWYVSQKGLAPGTNGTLLQLKNDISSQQTVLTWDFDQTGNYTTNVPSGTFEPPPGTSCH